MDNTASFSPRLIFILATLTAAFILVFILFGQDSNQWIINIATNLLTTENSTWLFALFIIAMLVLDIILPIPSSIVIIFATTTLGFVIGTIVIWSGLMLGCCIGYLIGTGSTRFALNHWISNKDIEKANMLASKVGIGVLVIMRGIPVLAETSVIAAGIIGYPVGKFLLVTGLANVGLAVAYGYVGAQADDSNSFLLFVGGSILVPVSAFFLNFVWEHVSHPQYFQLRQKTKNLRILRLDKPEPKTFKNIWASHIIDVEFHHSHSYPVIFENKVFNPSNLTLRNLLNSTLSGQSSVFIFIDSGVTQTNKILCKEIQNYFTVFDKNIRLLAEPVFITGGEAAKQPQQIDLIYRRLLNHHIDRHSYVIVIGGGAVLDAVGYACATFHRGIKLIRMPSTVLAQNDAGIGIKNGFNLYHTKNLIGTFFPPIAVLNDASFLLTLSVRERRSGLAEAVKVAAIRDAEFFKWMELHVDSLSQFEAKSSQYAIKRCAQLHIEQIIYGGDPFETGNSRPLDYGHWSAHKLESITNYKIRHGEAVAIGMALDARYAVNAGLLRVTEAMRLIILLEKLGLRLWHKTLDKMNFQGTPIILDGLEEFRQHLGGKLSVTLLSEIGIGKDVSEINFVQMQEALIWLKKRAQTIQ